MSDSYAAMSDSPVFVERIDYESALAWYMENDDGTEDALINAINVALVGVREAEVERDFDCVGCANKTPLGHDSVGVVSIRRFVTDWQEVEE